MYLLVFKVKVARGHPTKEGGCGCVIL